MRLSPCCTWTCFRIDRLARGAQFLDPRILNQVDPRRRTAVHDGHFEVIKLDDGVVDAEAAERREQVLNRFDRGLVGHQAGLQLLPAAEVGNAGWDFEASEIGSAASECRDRLAQA